MERDASAPHISSRASRTYLRCEARRGPSFMTRVRTIFPWFSSCWPHKLTWFVALFTGNLVAAIWYYVWKRRGVAGRTPKAGE